MKTINSFVLPLLTLFFSISSTASCAPDSSALTGAAHETQQQSAQTSHTTNRNSSAAAIDQKKLISDIINFIKWNKSKVTPGMSKSPIPVRERIISGFEQDPPRQLTLKDGTRIVWGWQNGQAEFKSLAIFDPAGLLRIVATADDIPIIYSRDSEKSVSTLEDYKNMMDERSIYSAPPALHIYTKDQNDADHFYPLVSRWIQASLMGFNASCTQADQEMACRLTSQIDIPTTVSKKDCADGNPTSPACKLSRPTPPKPPQETPAIDDFTQ
ncbi:hypothetical protein [Xanthomonas oryzae]|uniref:hypothetical protein n=1 Tax=Xanthomonas oryzae TaxID=347 RepID=UPI000A6D8CDF|nr:hypothetical protein [Xanthomonas oryzae]WVN06734.1 hypothetical protein V1208_00430 [Xanthomonas oryzae pv. oryzicola]